MGDLGDRNVGGERQDGKGVGRWSWLSRGTRTFGATWLALALGFAGVATTATATVTIGVPQSRSQVAVYFGDKVDDGAVPTPNKARCTHLNVPIRDLTGNGNADTWVKIELPVGSNLTLGANPDPQVHIGEVPPNAGRGQPSDPPPVIAYFYLCVADSVPFPPGGSGTNFPPIENNSVTINAYDRDPVAYAGSAVLLDSRVLSGTLAQNPLGAGLEIRFGNVKANSNKINSIAFAPAGAVYVGGTFTMTVTGVAGTVGADERIVFSPSIFKTFRSDLFELRSSKLTITGAGVLPVSCRDESGSTKVTNDYIACNFTATDAAWNGTLGAYTMVYTFAVTGATNGTSPITPIAYVDSGQQLKYTDPPTGSIPTVTTQLSASKTVVGPSTYQLPGGPYEVTYQIRVSNGANQEAQISEFIDTLPLGVTYVPGSTTITSSPASSTGNTTCGISSNFLPLDPLSPSSNPLVWARLFKVPAGGTCTLTFRAIVPAVASTYANCAQIQQFASVVDAGCANVTVLPAPVPGQLTIIKNAVGGDGTFGYTLTGPTSTTRNVVTSNGSGQQVITGLTAGNYTLAEAAQTGWDFTTAQCTGGAASTNGTVLFTMPSNGNITCTFTNTKRASLTVVKQTVPQPNDLPATNFAFTTSGTGLSPFSLVAGGTQSFVNLVPGQNYTVSETAASGFRLGTVVCSFNSGTGSVTYSATGATVTPQAGADVTCTFVNLRNSSVVINKLLQVPPGVSFSGNFGFTLNCDVSGPYQGTVAFPSPATTTISNVEAGRVCTLAETSLPTPPANWQWGTPSIDVATQTTVAGAATTYNVTNTLTNITGTLRIVKNVAGLSNVAATFQVQYDCGNGYAGTAAITTANSTGLVDITGVPGGSTCSVTEPGFPTPPAGYFYSGVGYSPSSVVVNGSATSTITVTNTLQAFSARTLNLAKVVQVQNPDGVVGGIGAGSPNVSGLGVTVTVSCTDVTAQPAGQPYTVFPGVALPVSISPSTGADPVCTVTETTRPTAPTNYSWFGAIPSPSDVTVPSGGATATLTNVLRRNTASLTIQKNVTGAPAGGITGGFGFTVNCGSDTNGDVAAAVALSAQTSNSTIVTPLPAGASCTVTEVSRVSAPSGYTWGAIPAPFTQAVPGTVTFTNPLTANPGTITVVKSISATSATTDGLVFTFNLSCSPALVVAPQTITWPSTSTQFSGIPAGTSCSVSETLPTRPANYQWGTPQYVPAQPLPAMPAGGAQTVQVTNSLTNVAGTLQVTKSVTGVAASAMQGAIFGFQYSCTSPEGPRSGLLSITLTNQLTNSTSVQIPGGASCTVSETNIPAPPPGYSYGTPTLNPVGGTVTVPESGTATVTVTNPLTAFASLSLTIAKQVQVQNPLGVVGGVGAGTPDLSTLGVTITVNCTGVTAQPVGQPYTVVPGVPFPPIPISPATAENPVCTVTETARPNAPTNYSWVGGLPAAQVVTIVQAGNAGGSAAFVNVLKRDAATLTIVKNVAGGPAAGMSGNFDFTVNCGSDTNGNVPATVTLTAQSSNSTAVSNLPAGASCTVNETTRASAPSGYTWGAMPAPVTMAVPGTATFTNPLSANVGSITVTKVMAPTNASVNGLTFTFNLSCQPSLTKAAQTITWPATTATFTGIPADTACTVSESLPTAPTNYAWGTPQYSPTQPLPAMPAGGAQAVTVTNTLNNTAGTLQITKTVTGVASISATYGFQYSCTSAEGPRSGSSSVTLTNQLTNTSAPISVPGGSTCTVTETGMPAPPAGYTYGTATFAPQGSVTVNGGATANVTVTNPLTAIPTLSLTLTKRVDVQNPAGVVGGVGAGTPDLSTLGVTVTVACSNVTAQPGGPYTIVPGAAFPPITISPSGSADPVCTVTETARPNPPANYTWVGSLPAPQQVTVVQANGAGGSATLVNVLKRDGATLTIQKTVTGGPSGGISGDFGFTVSCGADTNGNTPATVTLNAQTSGSTSVASLPAGATCTVTESTRVASPSGYTWGAIPSPVTLTVPGTASFTNPLTANPGSITVVKAIPATNAPLDGLTFTFSLSCVPAVNNAPQAVTWPANTTTFNGIPAGSVCTVSETQPAAPANYVWGAAQFSPSNTTAAMPAGGSQSVTVTNPISNVEGTLQITKAVTGVASVASAVFGFQYDCTSREGPRSGSVSVTLTNQLTNSATVKVPGGSTCTVNENNLPAAPDGYAYGTPTKNPAGPVTVPGGGTATVTVTNPLAPIPARSLVLDKDIVVQNPDGIAGGVGAGSPNLVGLSFPVSVNCTGATGTWPQTVTLVPGSAQTIISVQPLSPTQPSPPSCTVTENSPLPQAPQNYQWVSSPPAATTVTVGDAGASVMVVNTLRRLSGTLRVVVRITEDHPDDEPMTGPFVYQITCGSDTPAGGLPLTVTLNNATTGSATLVLPAGAVCTVTQTSRPSAPHGHTWAPPPAPNANVSIIAGTTVESVVTNMLIDNPATIEVTKVIANPPAGVDLSGLRFTFNLTCDEGTFAPQTVPYGVKAVFNGITAHAICRVTEGAMPTPPAGYSWGPPQVTPAQTPPMPYDAPFPVTVTNTLIAGGGQITVNVVLNAPPSAPVDGQTFTLTLTCSSGTYAPQTVVWPATSTVFTGIPNGATCSVVEGQPTPPTGYTYDAPEYVGSPSAPMPAGGSLTMTVTNTLRGQGPTPPVVPVPTLGETALLLLSMLMLAAGFFGVRRRA